MAGPCCWLTQLACCRGPLVQREKWENCGENMAGGFTRVARHFPKLSPRVFKDCANNNVTYWRGR
eukprot:4375804-Amphidinium_carterae.1